MALAPDYVILAKFTRTSVSAARWINLAVAIELYSKLPLQYGSSNLVSNNCWLKLNEFLVHMVHNLSWRITGIMYIADGCFGGTDPFSVSYVHMKLYIPSACSVVYKFEDVNINPFKPTGVKWLHFMSYGYTSMCSAPYWCNPPFLISDIWALWHSVLSARVPECQKLKRVG